MRIRRIRSGFTIIELLVVISIIALLISILLPAVGKARDNAKVVVSRSNLRELGSAMHQYAAEWQDRQYTPSRDTLASYGTSPSTAISEYNKVFGPPDDDLGIDDRWEVHPPIMWGWGPEGHMWCYVFHQGGHEWSVMPINFEGGTKYFGYFRFPSIKAINSYLTGRVYDQVFYAPKDRLSLAAAEQCMDNPGETSGEAPCNPPIWPTYCWSPAGLFGLGVLNNKDQGGYTDPFVLPSGLRVPTMSQVRYTDLKTHMMEHPWLQNVEIQCNPAFGEFGTVLDCEPYYFNHALTSAPVTLFYDGHISLTGAHEAMLADRRHDAQFGYGLWSRDTPMGENGYLIDVGYDFATTSFHILTTDGAKGRDILGKE